MSTNRAASIRGRLKQHADAAAQDFNAILTRYGLERLVYRLSVSEQAPNFLLKGALLFALWFDQPHRPTRDIDLLGFGSDDPELMATLFRNICAIEVDDGIIFNVESVKAIETRLAENYGGVRVELEASLDGARLKLQIDIGFGDAVTPAAQEICYPTLLKDVPAPRLRAYPRETVFAEKLEAIASLGLLNSRMKDYFDLLALARENAMNSDSLAKAIAATFKRRGTELPRELPTGLTAAFSEDPAKKKQWQAFVNKNKLQSPELDEVIAELARFSRIAQAQAIKLIEEDR